MAVRTHLLFSLIAAGALAAAAGRPAFAGSVAGTGGATEITQLANNLQLVNITAQEIESVSTQLQQLQNMMLNTASLPATAVAQLTGSLDQLASLVTRGQALAYDAQQISNVFATQHPDYKSPVDYANAYSQWTSSVLSAIGDAVSRSGLDAANFTNQADALNQVTQLSQTAAGQKQAIQAGNLIAVQEVEQLQGLHQTMLDQNNAQNAFLKTQMTDQAERAANDAQFMAPMAVAPAATGTDFARDFGPSKAAW